MALAYLTAATSVATATPPAAGAALAICSTCLHVHSLGLSPRRLPPLFVSLLIALFLFLNEARAPACPALPPPAVEQGCEHTQQRHCDCEDQSSFRTAQEALKAPKVG